MRSTNRDGRAGEDMRRRIDGVDVLGEAASLSNERFLASGCGLRSE